MRNSPKKQRREFSWMFAVTIAFIMMTWLIAIYLTLQSPDNESIFFDAIVALFTGVAFTGVIYSLHLQREDLQLNREELKINREEMVRTRTELERQLFMQHFQFMLEIFAEKITALSQNYGTEEYLQDLKLSAHAKPIYLTEQEFIAKFTPERLNVIKTFHDLILYYDTHYPFTDKQESSALYLLQLEISAQLASLLRVIHHLDLEHEHFDYLQPLLKTAMQNAITLAQKYRLIETA
ncbi:hypothetical protein DC083_06660 [Ignatzschineria ureiclastica]|uniref:Uncharacterized protein n=1 Tax=Ignatzschineria ureiclastica TaxID=472582 RepID=A0A2U2ADU2_9GAMM|nr:hypothetical protein [Ignatzschineria ureiclastica]PWD80787.1 hypothetical protein DC083_06660 [Ignatzschineria ureiclastica]GGZ94675.1 hypothetical protein GCM10007162_08200 [Ignatzschineria ureiclastica]